MPSNDLVILRGARTAFGSFGGSLKDVSAAELGVVAANAAMARSRVPADEVDHVIFGNVIQTSGSDVYLARHIGLTAGCPQGVPALTLNRACGSGLAGDRVGSAARETRGSRGRAGGGHREHVGTAPHRPRRTLGTASSGPAAWRTTSGWRWSMGTTSYRWQVRRRILPGGTGSVARSRTTSPTEAIWRPRPPKRRVTSPKRLSPSPSRSAARRRRSSATSTSRPIQPSRS